MQEWAVHAAAAYRFGRLGPEHHDAVQALRDEVIAGLADPDLYRREADERDFVARHLSGGGVTEGAWRGDRLVAFSAVGFGESEIAKQPFPLPPAFLAGLDLRRVLWGSASMVSRSERGAGLQRRLLERRLPIAVGLGRDVLIAFATIKNHVSWSNILAVGYEAVAVVDVDRPFFLLVRDASCGRTTGDVEACVSADDLARHRMFAGAGWRGVRKAAIRGAPALAWRPPAAAEASPFGA